MLVSALPSARALGSADPRCCLRSRTFKPSGDPPAVPRQLGDWAEEFRLPMLLTIRIEAGGSTLTHTSWTMLAPVSRQWMSGQAAALAGMQGRTPFVNLSPYPLRDLALPSVRRPPSPLDFYLSWLSPGFSYGIYSYALPCIACGCLRCFTKVALVKGLGLTEPSGMMTVSSSVVLQESTDRCTQQRSHNSPSDISS